MDAASRQATGTNGGGGEVRGAVHDGRRRELLEAQLSSLERARQARSQKGRGAPWLALTPVLAVPAGVLWGPGAALFALVASVTLAVMAAYIRWAHQQEYSDQVALIRQQLAEIEYTRTRGPRPPTPWRVPGKALQLFGG